jgi:hypothetical protein
VNDFGDAYLKHREYANACLHPVTDLYKTLMAEKNAEIDAQEQAMKQQAEKSKGSTNG